MKLNHSKYKLTPQQVVRDIVEKEIRRLREIMQNEPTQNIPEKSQGEKIQTKRTDNL